MSAVYKSIAKSNGHKEKSKDEDVKNRQRLLILSSRGVTYRHRHLLNDLHSMCPHSRKDAKLDNKNSLNALIELADLYNCNNVMYFEARKGKDLYIWLSKPPNGPTVKMHCVNIHTLQELNFTGNCLKGSKPILSFDATFETQPHLLVIKELLTHTFGVPPGSRKVKPFIDHVMGFTIADGKIWVRCYEIRETEAGKRNTQADSQTISEVVKEKGQKADTEISLIEIGPRMVLTPIVIQESSFGGAIIYENKEFVSPNLIRSQLRQRKAGKFARRAEEGVDRNLRRRELGLNTGEGKRKRKGDELDNRKLFA